MYPPMLQILTITERIKKIHFCHLYFCSTGWIKYSSNAKILISLCYPFLTPGSKRTSKRHPWGAAQEMCFWLLGFSWKQRRIPHTINGAGTPQLLFAGFHLITGLLLVIVMQISPCHFSNGPVQPVSQLCFAVCQPRSVWLAAQKLSVLIYRLSQVRFQVLPDNCGFCQSRWCFSQMQCEERHCILKLSHWFSQLRFSEIPFDHFPCPA